jgi:hypothetical protein
LRNHSEQCGTTPRRHGMTEESFLRYRLDVVRTMPEGAQKMALIESISAKILSLRGGRRLVR